MLETLRNAWRVPELRKKLLYTFFMLLLFRLVGVIPVAGIDLEKMASQIANYDALGLVNMMTGNQFSQATIMAMGSRKTAVRKGARRSTASPAILRWVWRLSRPSASSPVWACSRLSTRTSSAT